MCSSTYGPPGNGRSILRSADGRPPKPSSHFLRAKLDEHPFTAVLHRREPMGFKGDLRALHVRLVFSLDVRHYRLKAGEAGQGQNLAQAMELDDGIDAVRARGASPGTIR